MPKTSSIAPTEAGAEPIELVPDPVAAREFGTTLMGLWRWDHDAKLRELGWRPPVKIRNRNHRVRRFLEQFKAALIRKSIEERDRPMSSSSPHPFGRRGLK
jgi:hypothetical protein